MYDAICVMDFVADGVLEFRSLVSLARNFVRVRDDVTNTSTVCVDVLLSLTYSVFE